MKRCLFLMMFLCCGSGYLSAQKRGQERIDSLLAELGETKADTSKVYLLNDLSWENSFIGDYETALEQCEEALALAKKIGFAKGEAAAYNGLGTIYQILGNYPESLKSHFAALKMSEEVGNRERIAGSYVNIGIVHGIKGNYPETLKYFLSALRILEEIGDKYKMAATYTNIGNVYRFQSNYPEALRNHLAALRIAKEIGAKEVVANSHINIGNIHEDQGNYPEALKSHLAALQIAEETGAKKEVALSYNNIGMIHNKMGNYPDALENYLESLKISEGIKHKQAITATSINIGNVHVRLGDPRRGKEWLQKGLRLSKEIEVLEDIRDAYAGLAVTDSALGDYRGAYAHYKLYTEYKDSLFNEENTRKLTQTEMNYEFEKTQDSTRLVNEMEIAVRDASIASVRRQRWFFIGGLFALAVIGGLLYYQSRQRKKNNEKLTMLNTELDQANRIKIRFFSILNHDLRSPVSNLIHFLHLKKENPELLDEETRDRLEKKTTQGAENLLVTMEDLLLWSKGQMENFVPRMEQVPVDRLFDDIRKVFSGYQHIQFEYYNPDGVELLTDENYLKTIIRNLTSNSINVFTSTPGPQIVWTASRADGHPVLSITDNGPGAESERFRALYGDSEVVGIKTGLGLHLIRDLAKAIGCTIEVDAAPGKGTHIVLRFMHE